MTTFMRMLREAGLGLRRNFAMVISIILVTFISLTFVGAAVLLQMQIGTMKSYWYDKAQVAVYLCTSYDSITACPDGAVTDEQRTTIQGILDSPELAPYIKEYYFEDQDTAYQNFMDQFGNSEVAANVTPDQLGETFWVNLVDPSQSAIISEAMTNVDGVSSVRDQRAYLDQIFQVLNGASWTAITIAGLMLVAAVLLISTTIQLSAYARRKEIGIMRFVGASNAYIQTPFVLEGISAALIGSLAAGGVLVLLVQFLVRGVLAQQMPSTPFVGLGDALLVWPAVVLVGVLLAGLASAFAIRRYLRV